MSKLVPAVIDILDWMIGQYKDASIDTNHIIYKKYVTTKYKTSASVKLSEIADLLESYKSTLLLVSGINQYEVEIALRDRLDRFPEKLTEDIKHVKDVKSMSHEDKIVKVLYVLYKRLPDKTQLELKTKINNAICNG